MDPGGMRVRLAIVEFERRAWIEDVIGNADGADVERYPAVASAASSERDR
jgi:hypothetical protein